MEISVRDETMDATYVQTFGASENGDLVLLTDSHWRLSLAVNKGNAARALLLSPRRRESAYGGLRQTNARRDRAVSLSPLKC